MSALRATLLLSLVGCGGGPTPTPQDLLDTGWFTDTGAYDAATCPHKVVATDPADDATNWYWRDHPTVWVQTAGPEQYEIALQTASGVPVDAPQVWSEDGLSVELSFEGGLEANTDYLLSVTDCGAREVVAFRTSSFGAPLEGPAEDLEGRTWQLDLVNATWVEPGGIAGLLQTYFTTPVLFGVTLVQGTQVDFLAAPGQVDLFGVLQQDLTEPSWDFPLADFSQSPYFEATSDDVTFGFEGNLVPVTEFQFVGTLSPDMNAIGGGDLSGLGDTRNLGALINQADDPNALCSLAATLGVECQDCPDGEPYCLWLHAEGVDATLVPGLTLQPRD